MRFTIITTKPGQQPPQMSCDFYPPGGTIGRGSDNNLVLPDDARTISRLQAIVHISADGECRITNRGNVTRVVLNDIPLERGRQVELQDGDILGIDEYSLQVTDLVARAQAKAQPAAQYSASAASRPDVTATRNPDGTASIPTEIWDSLMEEFSISDNISSSAAPGAPSARNQPTMPVNDPLVNPFAAPEREERNPADPLAHFKNNDEPLFAEKKPATDTLFNQESLFGGDSIFADNTPSSLSQPEPGAKKTATDTSELDPLALFGGAGSTPAARNNDDPLGLMMGNAVPLTAPDAVPRTVPETIILPAPAKETVPETTPRPASALFGEDAPTPPATPDTDNAAQSLSSYEGITLPTPQTVQRAQVQTPKGRLRIDPVASANTATPNTTATGGGDVLQGELLAGLLEGMGLGDMQPVPQFDKENMRQLGQMLSMFSQGTVALLSSRSILKRGVKADMTMVLDDANNPFKLLPSGKTVLMQMFGTRMPGFMPPKKSVRDALIDLQAHQLGMISGIRAIIAAMLQSFNPEQLEEAAREDGAVSRIGLPGSRKAALWDYFVKRYGETAGEIEDDFHTLFGEAFLHAYDMEVNQYKDSQSGSEE